MPSHKEPQGSKTHIKLMINRKIDVTPNMHNSGLVRNLKKTKGADCNPHKWEQRVWVKTQDIDTKDKLAHYIRQNFGTGEFTICGYSYYVRKRRFKLWGDRWRCIPKVCKYYKQGRCSHNKWYYHKPGDRCLANKEYHPNWVMRCRIKIWISMNRTSEQEMLGYDYEHKFLANKMHHYRKMFWKD